MPGPTDWLAIGAHDPEDARLEAALAVLSPRLTAAGWRRASHRPAVWTSTAHRQPVTPLPGGLLLGRRHGSPPDRLEPASPLRIASRLMSDGWGGWVGLLGGAAEGPVTVIRDPSGVIDAFVWRRGPLWVAASDAHCGLDDLLPDTVEVDLDRLALILTHPAAASGASALRGIHAVAPGAAVTLARDGAPDVRQIWTPARAATQPVEAESLRVAVDAATRELLAPHSRVVGEISGGFDSAVVAGTTARLGLADRVSPWLTFHPVEPEGDERLWARAVAERAGLRLLERPKSPAALTRTDLERLAEGLRPGLQGLDVEYDVETAGLLTDHGASALLTGQGGDAVFFQYGTPAVAADRLARRGLAGLNPRFLHRLARWTRRSVWTVAGDALRHGFGLAARADPEAAAPPGPEVHPWLADLDAVPPAKRGQIRQLVNAQVFHGDCLRRRAAELLHPLLTQPVMEAGLGIPADVLVEGGRDRDLARRLFADRLPEAVLSRRGKGELSTYYGQVVRRTLPLANDLLIDGELVSAGLVDPEALRADLDPAHLIADGAYNTVLIRLVLELWLRRWRARLAARGQPLVEPGQDAAV